MLYWKGKSLSPIAGPVEVLRVLPTPQGDIGENIGPPKKCTHAGPHRSSRHHWAYIRSEVRMHEWLYHKTITRAIYIYIYIHVCIRIVTIMHQPEAEHSMARLWKYVQKRKGAHEFPQYSERVPGHSYGSKCKKWRVAKNENRHTSSSRILGCV